MGQPDRIALCHRLRYPGPVVGGSDHQDCVLDGQLVRASWQHKHIDAAIASVIGADLVLECGADEMQTPPGSVPSVVDWQLRFSVNRTNAPLSGPLARQC